MTKYSDLEYSDLRSGETNQLTTKKECCKQEYLWTCMLLCPIGTAFCVCYILVLFIMNQLKERDSMDDKTIIISRPWVIGDDVVNCSPEKPCEMTCHQYVTESGNKSHDCEFNNILIAISATILVLCGCTLLFPLCKLCIGYICHLGEEKTKTKKVVVASA